MGNRSMRIRIPSGSKLYIFGSALTSARPCDLDVLVTYDPLACPPEDAYEIHRDMVLDLEGRYGLPVHLTLLTLSEESGTEFIKRTSAVEFARARGRPIHSSGLPRGGR